MAPHQAEITSVNTCDIHVHNNTRILFSGNTAEFQKLIDAYHCLKRVNFAFTGMRGGIVLTLRNAKLQNGAEPTHRQLRDATIELYNIRQYEAAMQNIYAHAHSTDDRDGFSSDPHTVGKAHVWVEYEDIPDGERTALRNEVRNTVNRA